MSAQPQVRSEGPPTESERAARAALSRISEPGDAPLAAAVAAYGAEEVLRALLADPDGAAVPGGLSRRRVAGYLARLGGADPRTELDRARRVGIRVLCPGDPEWPGQLGDLGVTTHGRPALVPPLVLWARGRADLRLAAARSVAVIGARAATAYGEHVAAEVAAGVAEPGWTVVSGAAYGVDGAAHRGAMAADGTTVAVLACGVDLVYPRGHDLLLRRIAESGAVVSELAPGSSVTRVRLLQRNRLVAALTRGTVVVEAALRSGTATTARHASALGRVVMAVPGPVTSSASEGCHRLVRDGQALLVTGAEDVLEALAPAGEHLAAERRAPARPEDGLPPDVVRVLDALPVRRGVPLARLARTAGMDLPSVRAALGALVVDGLAEHDGTGYRLSAAFRTARAAPARG